MSIESVKNIEQNNGTDVFFESLKHKAKAFRNSGDFQKSREILQKAILFSDGLNLEGEVGYCFILFSNLCSDYLQRKGWYSACTEIANDKINKEIQSKGMSSKYDRWLQISEHRLGSLIYQFDIERGEKLISKSLTRKIHDDAKLRILDTLYGLRIKNKLYKGDFDFTKELIQYLKLIETAQKIGNDRSAVARKVHFLEKAREIVTFHIQQDIPIKDSILNQLLNGIARSETNTIRNTTYLFSDRKMQAKAASEEAAWLLLEAQIQHSEKNEALIEEAISILLSARDLIREKDIISDTYFDVLKGLGASYYLLQDFDRSLSSFNEAYTFCKELLTFLKNDENEVEVAIRGNESSVPELNVLNSKELAILKRGMNLDYRLLLDSSLTLAEQLIKSQSDLILRETIERQEFSRGFKYHDLSQKLNSINDNLKDLFKDVGDFRETIDDWRAQEDHIWDSHEFDIISEIERVANRRNTLSGSQKRVILLSIPNEKIIVLFNQSFFRFIIDHFIYNAKAVARQNDLKDWSISIGVEIKKGTVSLILIDNLGDFTNYNKVITSLNNDADKVLSMKGKKGGRGLVYVRDYIKRINEISRPIPCNIDYTWKLIKLNEVSKRLEVPIGCSIE